MNCEHCELEISGPDIVTCSSCGGNFCSEHVRETEIGSVCIDDIEMLELAVVDEDNSI